MWRSNAVMCVTVSYNKVLFSYVYFLTSQSEVDFGIALGIFLPFDVTLAQHTASLLEKGYT